jgi:hypothetical protein
VPHPIEPGLSRLEVHTTSRASSDTLVAYAELNDGVWRVAHRDGRAVTVASRVEVIERLLAVCAHTSSCVACGDTIEFDPGSGAWRHCLPPAPPHHAAPPSARDRGD